MPVLLSRAVRCLSGLALAAFAASPAVAAKVGRTIIIGGFYQQTTTTTSKNPPTPEQCTSTFFCYFVFDPIPAGKQVIVTQARCRVSMGPGDQELFDIFLHAMRPGGTVPLRFQTLDVTRIKNESISSVFIFGNTTIQLYDQRDRPLIGFGAKSNSNMSGYCTIAGQIIDAPP